MLHLQVTHRLKIEASAAAVEMRHTVAELESLLMKANAEKVGFRNRFMNIRNDRNCPDDRPSRSWFLTASKGRWRNPSRRATATRNLQRP